MNSLDSLRSRFGVFMIAFLWANVALLAGLSLMLDAARIAAVSGGVLVAAVTVVWWRDRHGATTRIVTSMALAGLVALLVFALRGERYQLDIHMYFFAGLALITGWSDSRALVAYSATVAVHHLLLNYLVPAFVFPSAEPDLARVLLHAVIVVIQTAVLIWIVVVVEKLFASADRAVSSARAAEETARSLAAQTDDLREAEMQKLDARHRLAEGFVHRVQDLVGHFHHSSREVAQAAQALSSIVEETSSSARQVADVAGSALHSVQTVAAGSEELAASIAEINQRASESAQVATRARHEAALSQDNISALVDATQKIGGVLDLIRAVAAQTNLLALNATIEAARAGDVGKGFAVVATEVKALAGRTAHATDDIAEKISEIQQVTDGTAQSIAQIVAIIDLIRDETSGIASAVEQQGASSSDISRNTHRAADDAGEVTRAIVRVGDNALKTGQASDSLRELSASLSQTAETLQQEVHRFVGELRTA